MQGIRGNKAGCGAALCEGRWAECWGAGRVSGAGLEAGDAEGGVGGAELADTAGGQVGGGDSAGSRAGE